jgi:capsular exopolysaccharide synthesis family protein
MKSMIVSSEFRPIERAVEAPLPPPLARVPRPESLGAVLSRHKWILLGTTVLSLLGGLLYLRHAAPLFESTSRIFVEQSGPKIIRDTDEGVMTRSLNYLYTQAQLIKAAPVLADAVSRMDVSQMITFRDAKDPADLLKRNLDVTVGRKDDILNVSFKSACPAEAATVVNTVVDAYVTFHETHKRGTCLEVLRSLQKEKAARAAELSEKLQALTEFKERNEQLAFQSERGNAFLDGVMQLSLTLGNARLTTLDRKADYETAKAMAGDPVQFRQFIEARQPAGTGRVGPEEDTLRLRLRDLQSRRVDGLRQVTVDHPNIKALDAEIRQVQDLIDRDDQRFAQAHLAALEQQYRVAADKEQQLSLQFEAQREQAVKLSQQAARCALLQSEYEQSKRLCEALDDRIRELNVTEDVGALNITILETARAAAVPAEPRKARLLALVLVVGLMAGGGLAFLRDVLDPRPRHPRDVLTGLLGSPLLGVIPPMSRRWTPERRAREVSFDATSCVTEAFRTIRTAIFSRAAADQVRTLQVTSAGRGEGKSTVLSNLAIAMAQTGRRVLIVDADLRCPTQHVLFGLSPEPGLTSFLSGTRPLKDVIQHTSVPGLDVLSCGPKSAAPAEMLDSRLFRLLLEKLKTRYHRILVDSPPLGVVADASILATACDATLLVVNARRSTRIGLLQARETLAGVNGRVIGGVINGVRLRGPGASYGYAGYTVSQRAEVHAETEAACTAMVPASEVLRTPTEGATHECDRVT